MEEPDKEKKQKKGSFNICFMMNVYVQLNKLVFDKSLH
jgi:hypothetical protein